MNIFRSFISILKVDTICYYHLTKRMSTWNSSPTMSGFPLYFSQLFLPERFHKLTNMKSGKKFKNSNQIVYNIPLFNISQPFSPIAIYNMFYRLWCAECFCHWTIGKYTYFTLRLDTMARKLSAYFIGQQHARYRTSIGQGALWVHILLPLESVSKRVLVGEVEHDDTAMSIFVVDPGHPGKPLLTCRNQLNTWVTYIIEHCDTALSSLSILPIPSGSEGWV